MLYIKKFFKNLHEDHVSEYSAQCAYYTILSFIPFLILLFTFLQFIHIDKDILYYVVDNLIPFNMTSAITDIMQEVSFKSLGTFSISVIFIIWSAGRGFLALYKGLQNIYNSSHSKPYYYLKLKSIIYTIFFILLIVIVLVLIIFGQNMNNILKTKYKLFNVIINLVLRFRVIWMCLALFLIFLVMYKYIPTHKVKIKSQALGAVFTAVAWYVISYVFSVYLSVFKTFSVIYGSLTRIMLLLMWVYACMYAILMGAEINKTIAESK